MAAAALDGCACAPGRRRKFARGLIALVVITLVAASERVHAGTLAWGGTSVGTLTTQGPFAAPNDFVGGVNFWAYWSLDPLQTKVDAADLRWLQLATFSKAVGSPYPNPTRPFIDPLSTQALGSRQADTLPWYDITGLTKGTIAASGGGDDAWMGDGPFAPWGIAPLTFSVQTFVVALLGADSKQARILGGVGWGYTIDTTSGNQVTPLGVTDLSDTPEIRAAVNAALALDFPGWSVVVPEPAGVLSPYIAVAMLAAIAWRLRRR